MLSSDDGVFRYYDIKSDSTLTSPIPQVDGYTLGWSSIDAPPTDPSPRPAGERPPC